MPQAVFSLVAFLAIVSLCKHANLDVLTGVLFPKNKNQASILDADLAVLLDYLYSTHFVEIELEYGGLIEVDFEEFNEDDEWIFVNEEEE
ncbi:hypothetical protein BC937DRAFT_90652 [Endogone sp. FLAS-F59071]|nr:hypothetical protein BC937DRAFT_90652 [Endogone sp. FLAS-F59071]|eukprot:RUS16919.1 hypothetical protein BC937DRAFT_90652 [Endogone sp. FLAS-F59071]